MFILNGQPRSGKSTTAAAIQAVDDVPTMILGVDAAMASTPANLLPGIGLRPGGERPDLEPFVLASYRALFDSIAAHAGHGIDVVADLGIHDSYSRPLGLWLEAAERLDGFAASVVGVRCRLDVVVARRAARPDRYVPAVEGEIPLVVRRWEEAVHDPGWYDLEIDTSTLSPDACAAAILGEADRRPPSALARHR